jgi:demethylmenaquinone methyltransferase/2-methoxy-6-polyprenyl-1,4-benzoquinol methylase
LTVDNPKNLVPKFFDKTSTSYDKVAVLATFGKDRYWKKEILKYIQKGTNILDLACGTGILTRKLAKKLPNSKIIGLDITQSYLEIAKRNSFKYTNISFIHQDAEKLNLAEKFDCIVSSYIPKYCNPELLVQRCISHLNSEGTIILHDFTFPKNRIIGNLWDLYFILLNFVGNFIPTWKEAFIELPRLIKSSSWLELCEKEMKRNGLEVTHQFLTLSSSAILVGKKV